MQNRPTRRPPSQITQAHAFALRAVRARDPPEAVKAAVDALWAQRHARAGEDMYRLCLGLRGFYMKAGQFIGSRADFVPEPMCRKLMLLCDKASQGASMTE